MRKVTGDVVGKPATSPVVQGELPVDPVWDGPAPHDPPLCPPRPGGWFKEAATKRKVKAFPSYTGKRPITRSYSRWASPSASRE